MASDSNRLSVWKILLGLFILLVLICAAGNGSRGNSRDSNGTPYEPGRPGYYEKVSGDEAIRRFVNSDHGQRVREWYNNGATGPYPR